MNKQVLVIESQADYDKWYHGWQAKNAHVSNELNAVAASSIDLSGGDAAAGGKLFAAKCSACHAMGPFDQKLVGPGLKGVLSDPAHPKLVNGDPATAANVAKILQNGYNPGSGAAMPNQAANGLSDKDIANLVAYLSSEK
jgi:mono/diheme cytochrome c family protein